MKKVAWFLEDVDLLLLKENTDNYSIFHIVYALSENEIEAKKILKLNNVISINKKINIEKCYPEINENMIKSTDFTEKLKANNIQFLLVNKSSEYLHNWGIKNSITIITPHYLLQKDFENKIFFEKFLKRHELPSPSGEILCNLAGVMKPPFVKTVIQVPNSTGSNGTFVSKSKKHFNEIVKKLDTPLLLREFKEGLPLGSSILIRKNGDVLLTALERQCFIRRKEGILMDFLGIQWIPYDFFSRRAFKNIEELLIKMGKKLHKEGVYGFVSFDLILDANDSPHFIECNPRVTTATNQIMGIGELCSYQDFLKILLDDFDISPNKQDFIAKNSSHLAKNTFDGCQMFIYSRSSRNLSHAKKDFFSTGFYVYKEKSIEKIELNNRLDFMNIKNGFLYFNWINNIAPIEKDQLIGCVVVNFPLFGFKTGNLNVKGKYIYEYFS